MMFDRLADGIQGHAKMIIFIWAIILCFAGFFAIQANDVMIYDTSQMTPPDSESVIGFDIMTEKYPASSANEVLTPILVIPFEDPEGQEESERFVRALNDGASEREGINGVISMDPMVSESGEGIMMAFILVESQVEAEVIALTPEYRDFVSDVKESAGFTGDTYLTGSSVISYDVKLNALEDISKIDPFTILLVLVLIGLFFRSFITSATPPITIGVAFAVTMALIFFIGQVLNIFFITNMMILVSMMGAGCDYCIFILARYREELRNGLGHDDALHQAIVWAGESIAISGASVVIGFGALALCSYSLVSVMGICLALGVLIALIAALTLIPAIVQVVGDRIFWPTTVKEYMEGGKATKGWFAWFGELGQRYFHMSARFSIRHAKAIVVAAIVLTVPCVYMMTESEDSYDMVSAMLSGDSGKGMEYIGEYADQGMVMPNYGLIEYKEPIATVSINPDKETGLLYWTDYWYEQVSPTLQTLYAELAKDDNISYTDGPFEWSVMLRMIEEEGITDTEEKLEFIKKNVSANTALVFNQAIMKMEERGLDPEYIFNGPGMMIGDLLDRIGTPYDWDAGVQKAKDSGITDPDGIVDYVVEDFKAVHPDDPGKLSNVIGLLRMMGMTPDVLVNGFTPIVDYIMNIYPSSIGGDFVETGKGTANYISVTTATEEAAMSLRSMDSISYTDEVLRAYVQDHPGIVEAKWNTGYAVMMYEISQQVKSQFLLIEVLVIVMIILLLFVVMRSYLIPLRSAFTILMSLSWTLALMHLVFVNLMGMDILWLTPILLLVICLGLGMDYDILLTTRIRENVVANGMSNDDAITAALVHTGSVITICGLIMGGAFGTLMISGMEMFQQFGFGLCVAILIDALIVRTYIVPAMMHLLGDWAWKGPGRKTYKAE